MQEEYQMRRFIAIAMLIAFAATGAHADVKWETGSWEDILATAKKENRHIFIDFYTVWCGPCKRLDKITYKDEGVTEFTNTMLNVKYDCEKGFGEELADQYKVAAYPTLLVIGPDGKEVDRHVGYLDPEPFIETIKGYTDGIGTQASYLAQLEKDPDNVELLLTVGTKYADAVMPEDAEATLKRAMELDPNDEMEKRAEIYYNLGFSYYSAENYEPAKKWCMKLINEYGDTEWYSYGERRLAYVNHELGNDKEAVAGYYKLVELKPDDASTLNGFAWFCSQRKIGLDLALPVALKAVEVSDRDPGILDTLAEVYYAQGDYDNALLIGKEALESDPEDSYFQGQVEKYKKAKAEADSQASR